MQISDPKPFRKVPAPRNDFLRPGRPTSPLFKAIEQLRVGRCIEVQLSPGKAPSLATIRTSIPRWGRKLSRSFSLRTSGDDQNTIEIYRTK